MCRETLYLSKQGAILQHHLNSIIYCMTHFQCQRVLDIIHIYYWNKLVFTDPYTDCVLHNGIKTGYYVIDNKHYVITNIFISNTLQIKVRASSLNSIDTHILQ